MPIEPTNPSLHDEHLHAALAQWWLEEPVPFLDGDHITAVDDIKTLLDALDAAGYKIVRK